MTTYTIHYTTHTLHIKESKPLREYKKTMTPPLKRLARPVPDLALLPLEQIQAREAQRKAKEAGTSISKNPQYGFKKNFQISAPSPLLMLSSPIPSGLTLSCLPSSYDSLMGSSQEEHRSLGERFLCMMATLTRISNLKLDTRSESENSKDIEEEQTKAQADTQLSTSPAKVSPSKVLGTSPQKKKTLGFVSAADIVSRRPELVDPIGGDPLKIAHAASAHGTFEITMLLQPSIDQRQSSLVSPIKRKLRKTRRRRRRRLQRLQREWKTSHVTWNPRASAEYAGNILKGGINPSSSRLILQLAHLKTSASTPTLLRSRGLQMAPREEMDQESVSDDEGDDEEDGDDEEGEDIPQDEQVNHVELEKECGNSESSANLLAQLEDHDNIVISKNSVEVNVIEATLEQAQEELDNAVIETSESTNHIIEHEPQEDWAYDKTPLSEAQKTGKEENVEETERQERDDDEEEKPEPPKIEMNQFDHVSSVIATTDVSSPFLSSKTCPLRMQHQAGWISSDLRTWLLQSGMFHTRPRSQIYLSASQQVVK